MNDQQSEDERAELEQLIAEQLSMLSQARDLPDEFERASEPFSPLAVDFRTNGWMSRVADVEQWLHLEEPLNVDGSGDFVLSLARALGFENDEGVEGSIDLPVLSTPALTRLQAQSARAVQLQERFLESLQEVADTAAASKGWVNDWEDAVDDEGDSGGPITAKTDIWPIVDFSSKASKGKLELSPSYQRDDVWPTADSAVLIESILRGIPLPSVILLEPDDRKEESYEVVDGKQRLTSILRFIGQHPAALKIVDEADGAYPDQGLKSLFHDDYPRFKRKWKTATGESLTATLEKKYYFPFRLRPASDGMTGSLATLSGKYYTQIRDEYVEIASTTEQVADLFEMTSEYRIPVILYKKATPRQIHEVFNLYNKQGKHLNAEEIRNALFHRYDLMRGLLVASGDSPSRRNEANPVAPFLNPVWADVSKIAYQLEDMAFGVQRYKKTKILSWLTAMLVLDSHAGETVVRRSTARQTNALLERVEGGRFDPLRDEGRLQELFKLLALTTDAHSQTSYAWAPRFKDGNAGTKWQELQLVATLMGIAAAGVVLGPELVRALQDVSSQIKTETEAASRDEHSLWRRPAKTQTQTQLVYQARVALRVLELLEVDPAEADRALRDRFGGSTVRAWQLLAR